jgi:acetyltransferase-like isoleucine patch superfamily enzyme
MLSSNERFPEQLNQLTNMVSGSCPRSGVTLEDHVCIGHGVIFINDRHPSVEGAETGAWTLERIVIRRGASIGSGAEIMAGVTVGEGADVATGRVVLGVPAGVLARR